MKPLSKRLSKAASYIRKNAVFADIGTDHACLPIFAVKQGLAVRAVASDVNEGPLERAKLNVSDEGLSDKISCVLAYGFDGMANAGITDAAVCGMGGELIEEIMSRAYDVIHKDGFRLIIQPMTRPEAARHGLWTAGFEITEESVVFEEGKYYTVICADIDGGHMTHDDGFEAVFGDFSIKRFENSEVRDGYFAHEIEKYRRMLNGRIKAGLDVSSENETIDRLFELKNAIL